MVKHEWSLADLRNKAEAYCASAEHCIWDVRQKLRQWGATNEDAESIIAHLQAERFVDEQRYCNAFVHDKLLYLLLGDKVGRKLLLEYIKVNL